MSIYDCGHARTGHSRVGSGADTRILTEDLLFANVEDKTAPLAVTAGRIDPGGSMGRYPAQNRPIALDLRPVTSTDSRWCCRAAGVTSGAEAGVLPEGRSLAEAIRW
jgi:hypothetical protein